MVIMTVGHGALSLDKFLRLLTQHGIALLVDVRSKPYSRWHPHFNKAALQGALVASGCAYHHMPDLGGLHDGAGQGAAFHDGIAELLGRASEFQAAIMCGCGKYEGCHREMMIGAHLRASGHRVVHILHDGGSVDSATGRLLESAGPEGESQEVAQRQLSLFPSAGAER